MHTIGYVPLSVVSHKDYINTLEITFSDIQKFQYHQIDLKKMVQLDVLIIQDDNNQFMEMISELLLYIRAHAETFVWIISEQLPQLNRKIYSKLGADGLAGKDTEPEELAALIINNLSRYSKQVEEQYLKVQMDSNSLRLTVNNVVIKLTKLEYLLMELLYENMNNLVTYEQIYSCIWDEQEVGASQYYKISNLIFLLRRKLKNSAIDLTTVRLKGYILSSL